MVKKLKFSGAILFCAAISFLCSEAHAQVSYAVPQSVVPSWGTVINNPMQIATTNCPCGCGSSSACVENPGNCNLWVSPGGYCGKKTSQKYNVTPPSDCEGQVVNKKFYSELKPGEATITVPVKVEMTEEKYRFERKTYKICGCTLSVCVPCAIDTICSSQCRPEKRRVPVVAKIRTGTRQADIWVSGVTGLPSEAVVALNVTAAEANAQLGSNFSY